MLGPTRRAHLDRARLIAAVSDHAKFADTAEMVDVLTERGLVADGQPADAGRDLVTAVLAAGDPAEERGRVGSYQRRYDVPDEVRDPPVTARR